jgi:hypothetical protein
MTAPDPARRAAYDVLRAVRVADAYTNLALPVALGRRGVTGRDAAFAVLIVSNESKLPARTEELHEYQGNKMVAVFDKETLDPFAIELVYRYASARALMASELDLDVDAAGVDALVERAAAALKRGKGVRDCLTRAEQGIDGAREGFNAIVADVESCLGQVQELISPAVDAP